MKKIEMIGKRFNNLTVIKELSESKGNHIKYLCRCDCGNEVVRYGYKLRNGDYFSCGCHYKKLIENATDIPKFEGLYCVNKKGEVLSLRYGKVLKPYTDKEGYNRVRLTDKFGNNIWIGVHKIVALTFIENPRDCKEVNHKNFIRNDNRFENLEWCTAKENVEWSIQHFKGVGHKGVYSIDENGMTFYPSLSEASRKTGIPISNICKCCKGERKRAGNCEWHYTEIEITEIKNAELD